MALELRNYQIAALASLDSYFARARGNPVVSMATGTGKSIVIAEFCRRALTQWPETRIIMLVHVRELVAQNAAELQALWPEAPLGIYSASLARREVRPITFCSVQSVYDQAHKFGSVDLVLIDEAHRTPAKGDGMYRTMLADLLKVNPKTKVLGFTATPFRLDSGRLTDPGGIFTDLVFETDLLQMIQQGWLCRLVSRSVDEATIIDTTNVPVQAGEFSLRAMGQQAMTVTQAACKEIVRLGAARKSWLIFSCGVDHGFDVAAQLTEMGVPSRMLAGDTPSDQRTEIVEDFKAGRLRCLVNAQVLVEGFNAPATDLVVLLRSTMSPGLLVQMCGRGMRNAPDKRDCLVLDFGGNFERHGPINAIRPRARRADGSMSKSAPVVPRLCFTCGSQEVVKSEKCENCETLWPKPEARHATVPSAAPVLVEPEDVEVVNISYVVHRKAGKPESMRVTYETHRHEFVDEFVCLEHLGYAQQKARHWWSRRSAQSVPSTAAEAVARSGELRWPERIRAGFENGYPRVLGFFWYQDPEKEQQCRDRRRPDVAANDSSIPF